MEGVCKIYEERSSHLKIGDPVEFEMRLTVILDSMHMTKPRRLDNLAVLILNEEEAKIQVICFFRACSRGNDGEEGCL